MTEAVELKIKKINVGDLIPYARNSRTHSEEQVAQIAGSIQEFGFTNPVLIDGENGIIAGHGRVMAASKLKLKEVPTICLGHLSAAQKKAYIIADNKLALNAGWDEELLGIELAELNDEEFDLGLTGFSEEELAALMGSEPEEGLTDEDAVPEAPEVPVTVEGDVWLFGRHRLMCGNSENLLAIEKLMKGESWDVCIFDPPYEMEGLYYSAIPKAKPGKKLISFWDFKRFAIAGKTAMDAGWNPLYELIWDNVTSWYTPNRPLARHKACGVFGDDPFWNFDKAIIKDGKKRTAKTVSNSRGECDYTPLDGAVHMRTVEAFPTTSESGGHAHSKPIKWITAIFRGVGGDSFLDLFGGSGSTAIACEMVGTESYTMELEPISCDVIIQRWQDFTGQKATHEETGKTFDELKEERS